MAARRQRLAECRRARGYSQEALAGLLGVDRSSVVRWEGGDTEPQPSMRPKLAGLLAVTTDELETLLAAAQRQGGDAPAPSDLGEHDDMNRRELLRILSLAGALVALPPATSSGPDRDLTGLAHSGSLDEREELNAHLWQVFSLSTSKRLVYPMVRQELGQLTARLDRPHTPAAHARLCALAGDLFQLTGEIFFDSNRYTEAAYCYTMAANAAKEAGAFDLWACAMTRHAFVSLYERQVTEAVAMLDVASRVARRGDSQLSTRYWVAAAQAEAFAKLGDLDSCNRSLDAAEKVRGLTGRIHTGGWLRFDGSRLAEQRGTCYLELGRPALAADALTRTLAAGKLSLRRRGSVLTDLAVLGVQQRDVDQVLDKGSAAVELARHTDSGYVAQRLRSLQLRLPPLLGDRRVIELNDQIRTVTRAVA